MKNIDKKKLSRLRELKRINKNLRKLQKQNEEIIKELKNRNVKPSLIKK